jgi:site-specific recombinase XerD
LLSARSFIEEKSRKVSVHSPLKRLSFVAAWEGHIARLFLVLKQRGTSMRPEEVKALVHRYIGERVEEWEDSWYGGNKPVADGMSTAYDEDGKPSANQWQDHLSAFSVDNIKDHAEALKRNDLSSIERTAQEFIQRYSLSVERESAVYRLVCRELLKAEQTIAKAISERVQGNYGDAYGVQAQPTPTAATAASLSTPSVTLPAQARLFSVAVTEYLKHFEKRAPATLREKQSVLGRFMTMTGSDKAVHTLTKQHCIKYRDALSQEVSQSRVNTTLSHVGHFFKWCMAHEHYPDGKLPTDGLAYEDVETVSFDPFTNEDLQNIFGSEEYRKQLHDGELARHFLPLVLLYSGSRREEIAGLPLSEVKEKDGIWYFNIKFDAEKGRRLKNKASVRTVPVHSFLIANGFLAYAESVKKSGAKVLFPNLGKDGRLTAGDSVGKWHKRVIEKCVKVNGRKLALHSYRSTVISKLHERGVKGEVVRALVGHEGVDIHEKTYLHVALSTLKEAIEKLDHISRTPALRV